MGRGGRGFESRLPNHAPDAVLVTGGSGFIGSATIRELIANTASTIVNADKLTYAANPSDPALERNPRYRFERVDIRDRTALDIIFRRHRPTAIIHLAAESHVDRSIAGPGEFILTNVVGTQTLLDAALQYWQALDTVPRQAFRFLHVSTDEVFGSIAHGLFRETSPYAPNSPYAASKAASDHLVRAWRHTYGLPAILSRCSNNYGPRQFPEKLIPQTIMNALSGRPIPVYGDGKQRRDWIHVDDHARALLLLLTHGRIGETYNIGTGSTHSNIAIVRRICAILDELVPKSPYRPHKRLVAFVDDRPGHDKRYAIDARKITQALGWRPAVPFESGLEATVEWYVEKRPRHGDRTPGTYNNQLVKPTLSEPQPQ